MKPLLPVVADVDINGIEILDESTSLVRPPLQRIPDPARPKQAPMLPVFASLLALATWIGAHSAGATVIISHQTLTEIVVGADSKLTWASDPAHPEDITQTCKLGRLSADAFIGISGVMTFRGVELTRIAADGFNGGTGTWTQRIHRLDKAVASALRETVRTNRATTPAMYEHFVKHGITQVIFVGFDAQEGRLISFLHDFRVKDSPIDAGVYRRVECPTPLRAGARPLRPCDADNDWVSIGDATTLLHDHGNQHPEDFRRDGVVRTDPVGTIRRLVQIAIDHVDSCGPPIDTVRIDASGAHWVDRKRECPE